MAVRVEGAPRNKAKKKQHSRSSSIAGGSGYYHSFGRRHCWGVRYRWFGRSLEDSQQRRLLVVRGGVVEGRVGFLPPEPAKLGKKRYNSCPWLLLGMFPPIFLVPLLVASGGCVAPLCSKWFWKKVVQVVKVEEKRELVHRILVCFEGRAGASFSCINYLLSYSL